MSNVLSQNAPVAEAGTFPANPGWLAVPVVCALLLGGTTAWQSLDSSLWIDELHTAWSSEGTWPQVFARSAIGNQTPTYFVLQWWLGRTFGQSEQSLRLPSLIAWCALLGLLAVALRGLVTRSGHRSLWLVLCLVALDRQQIFFATEARPYMILAAVVLLGWLSLRTWLKTAPSAIGSQTAWLIWVTSCIVAMWLQPIAVLFIAAQGLFALLYAGPTRWKGLGLAALVMLIALWPMRTVLEPVWQQRQAWAAFAADLRWQNILKQFPIVVVALPGIVAKAIGWTQSNVRSDMETRLANRMWLWAWLVPLALVVLLTACKVAPLMHARYLFAATLPLTLWTASQFASLRSRWLVATLLPAMLLLQSFQQGSWSAWQSGKLPTIARAEDWRGAAVRLSRSTESDIGLRVYCASNLIEGGRTDYLSDDPLRQEYLSMPVRSLYSIPDQADIVPLLNYPTSWAAVIASHGSSHATRWLLVRCSQEGLAIRLRHSGIQPVEQIDFGAVQLVRF